ncbi:MAG: hypothetical protein AAF960_07075 [Bacteroidota bacterium]
MLKTVVKASSVSNLTDARYFAAWHVDWLGFDLTPSGLATLPLAQVKEIKDWIEGPKIIGQMDVLDLEESQQLIDFLELEYIQVGMYAPVTHLNGLHIKTIIKEVVIEPSTTLVVLEKHLESYFEYVDYFQLDFNKNGIDFSKWTTNTLLKLTDVQRLCQQYDIFLSINFDGRNTVPILEKLQPMGIDLKGGMEEKVGFKSFDELDEIFEVLELEE